MAPSRPRATRAPAVLLLTLAAATARGPAKTTREAAAGGPGKTTREAFALTDAYLSAREKRTPRGAPGAATFSGIFDSGMAAPRRGKGYGHHGGGFECVRSTRAVRN